MEWISVEDRLPTGSDFNQGWVIVATNDYSEKPMITPAVLNSSGTWLDLENSEYGKPKKMNKVTHWMPLPQPPIGE